MWIFVVWAVLIGVGAAWVRSSGLDVMSKAVVAIGLICGPYWALFYNELRKLPASTIFWRSTGVFLLGIIVSTPVTCVMKGELGRPTDDAQCTNGVPSRFGC